MSSIGIGLLIITLGVDNLADAFEPATTSVARKWTIGSIQLLLGLAVLLSARRNRKRDAA